MPQRFPKPQSKHHRRSFVFDIRLSVEQLERFYAGRVTGVHATSRCGVKVRFPIQALRPHITREGISGSFRLDTENHRLVKLSRL